MDGIISRIDLLSFASGESRRDLDAALAGLGFATHDLGEKDWTTASERPGTHPLVLLLGRRDYPRDEVRSLVARREAAPKVAVVERGKSVWDLDLLSRCTEFLAWPCPAEELRLRLTRAGIAPPRAAVGDESELREEFAGLSLFGRSPAFLRVLRLVKKFGRLDAPVLVQGATGTGKDLVARAIHYLGLRRPNPFIPINCGAIPDNLVENELFGHESGAFTDAKKSQSGLVAQADRGTLFLDEIDALSPKAQVTLLRFLEEHEYRPLGGGRARKIDVRIIAAANANLEEQVRRGEFRQDLLFRLNILVVALPPLSQRPEDLPLLARHFVRQVSRRYRRPQKTLHPQVLDWMAAHDWPGNIRELENLIHRAFVVSEGPTILLGDLLAGGQHADTVGQPTDHGFEVGFQEAKAQVIERFERRYLNWLMTESEGNVTLAASRAGKERRSLGRLLKKHGIRKSRFRADAGGAGPTRPGPS